MDDVAQARESYPSIDWPWTFLQADTFYNTASWYIGAELYAVTAVGALLLRVVVHCAVVLSQPQQGP
jgi:hypothetical protein